jgi:hypothetical protein
LAFCLFFAMGATAGTVAYNAALANGVYYGSGNQNTGFTVLTEGNLELGLGAVIRYKGPAAEVNDNYYVPVGQTTQPLMTGSTWGITFSVDTQAGGGSAVLSDYRYLISIADVLKITSVSFDPSAIPDDTHRDVTGVPVGFQNSEAPSFAFISGALSFDMNAVDTYIVTLSATNKSTGDISSDGIIVNAQAPEPATSGLIGFALLSLGLTGSRRFRRNK